MLHLVIDSEFTYLNYLSVMSAVRFNPVTLWIKNAPENNPLWDIVKNNQSFNFDTVSPTTGITLDVDDFTGRTNIIYIAPVDKKMVDDAKLVHPTMYEDEGEFEEFNICLITVDKPELITKEFVSGNSALANVIKHVLLERIWNVKI